MPQLKDRTFYFMQAAKMITYEVDIYERVIYVPEDELDIAKSDPGVMHLCNADNRFHIQSCIPADTYKKEVYNPDLLTKNVQVRKEAKISPYTVGMMYRVVSTRSIMKIVRTEQKKVQLTYLSYDERLPPKSDLIISEEQLETNLRKGILEPYNQ